MPVSELLIRVLADGHKHAEPVLANTLSVAREDVSQHVSALRAIGLHAQRSGKDTWQLVNGLQLLDEKIIRRHLDESEAATAVRLEVLQQTDSTNDFLLALPGPAPGVARVCLAEYQRAGRGRMGRGWQAPFAGGLCLSAAWSMARVDKNIAALSLAIGVAIHKALTECGITGVRLKWPNDVLWQGRKLAGTLIDLRGDTNGPARVVVGIGLNYRLDHETCTAIADSGGLAPVDITEICNKAVSGLKHSIPKHAKTKPAQADFPDRNYLAAQVIRHVLDVLQEFETRGLAPFVQQWQSIDGFSGLPVWVKTGDENLAGVELGIDSNGALRVQIDDVEKRFASAEVSLRAR